MDVGNNKFLGNFTPSFPYGVDLPLGIEPRFSNGYNMADSICTYYAQALFIMSFYP